MNTLKMYIAVLDTVPDHMVPVLVAHSVLGAHLRWNKPADKYETYDPLRYYNYWLTDSFRKCVLKVNSKEFAKISILPDVYAGHENTVLNGEPSCLVACPRSDWPNVIKFAKLWKPNE